MLDAINQYDSINVNNIFKKKNMWNTYEYVETHNVYVMCVNELSAGLAKRIRCHRNSGIKKEPIFDSQSCCCCLQHYIS